MSGCRKHAAYSLIELILVVTLTAIIAGSLVSVYMYTSTRAAHMTADASALSQVRQLLDEASIVAENAVSCSTSSKNGQKALVCIMPLSKGVTTGLGTVTTYDPFTVSKRGEARYGASERIWFYLSDATGDFGVAGDIVWKAVRYDNSDPTGADVDRDWTFYYGDASRNRWSQIDALDFSVTASSKTVLITASSGARSGRPFRRNDVQALLTERTTYLHSLSRTVFWRNWRR